MVGAGWGGGGGASRFVFRKSTTTTSASLVLDPSLEVKQSCRHEHLLGGGRQTDSSTSRPASVRLSLTGVKLPTLNLEAEQGWLGCQDGPIDHP